MGSVAIVLLPRVIVLTYGKTMASNYVDLLPQSEKERYNAKILAIDGLDPHEIPKSSWTYDKQKLPDVNQARIVQYFVLGKSAYTCEEYAAYKSLKAYRMFVSGWVRDIASYQPDGCLNTVVTAKASVFLIHFNG